MDQNSRKLRFVFFKKGKLIRDDNSEKVLSEDSNLRVFDKFIERIKEVGLFLIKLTPVCVRIFSAINFLKRKTS